MKLINMGRESGSSMSAQRGVTLVELMVAVAINLALVLAATLLYLNTRNTQKKADERSAVYETGQFALELLAREVGNAAFYPAVSDEPPAQSGVDTRNVRFSHDKAAQAVGIATPYLHGVFGCDGQAFNGLTHVCENYESGGPQGSDSLVISYFTNDAFSLNAGQRADCTRADVINDTRVVNNAQRAVYRGEGGAARDSTGPLPDAPLLVANRYRLVATSFLTEGGQKINTFALACSGNGNNGNLTQKPPTVELVRGVEQLVLRYGVFDDDTKVPTQYLTASDVSELDPKVIEGEDLPLSGWQRVVSVRICMMVRSFSATAERGGQGDAWVVTDCNGNTMTRSGAQLRRFERVVSVKNRQGSTVALTAPQ